MFFDSQPNVYYPQIKGGAKLSKNLFRRVRFRDNLNSLYINSVRYTIKEGETPESISYDKYDSTEWYWTILLLNNIIDLNNDWPVDAVELDTAINKKYGNKQNDVKHWETYQIKNNSGVILLPGGVIIESNQGLPAQSSPTYYPTYSFTYDDGGVIKTLTGSQVLNRVTNRDFEYDKNEKKKEIFLIKKQYLSKMKDEISKLFAYDTEYNIDELGVRLPDI
jgi:hypothetical protein